MNKSVEMEYKSTKELMKDYKIIILILASFLIAIDGNGQQAVVNCVGDQIAFVAVPECGEPDYVLVFEDQFEEPNLDQTKWELQGWSQGALTTDPSQELNTLNNISLNNGIMSIVIKDETVIGKAVNWMPDNTIMSDGYANLRPYEYTASNLWTKYQFWHGKFEIRCKLPPGNGTWPAFWLYGSNATLGSSELDVFEFWNHSTDNHLMTLHKDADLCGIDYSGPDYSQDYHVFTAEWDNFFVKWYVDNDLKRITARYIDLQGQPVPCTSLLAFTPFIKEQIYPNIPMNLITNCAVQRGTYAPDNQTQFPQSFEIDYVRYYKKIPCEYQLDISAGMPLPFSSNVYNVIVAGNINVYSGVSVQSGTQLQIIGTQNINIDPGFVAEPGSNFEATIIPYACDNWGGRFGDPSTFDDEKTIFQNQDVLINNDLSINTVPNPFETSFNVNIDGKYNGEVYYEVRDAFGKVIIFEKYSETPEFSVDLKGAPCGVYFLSIKDKLTQEVKVVRIMKN